MVLSNYHLYKQLHPDHFLELPETEYLLHEDINNLKYKNVQTDSKPPSKPLPLWLIHLLAGGVSGPVSRTITAPIDRIRLTIQVESKARSIAQTIKHLLKDGGFFSFWRGNLINIIKVTPEMSLRFAFYERIKQHIKLSDKTTAAEKMLAGAIAGVCAQFSIYPLEVLKTRMTVRKTGQYDGLIDAVKKIYKIDGLLAFYRGYCASAIGIIPYTAIDLTTFETLKHKIVYTEDYRKNTKLELFFRVMICAIIATTCGQAGSYPFYLVKARQQAASQHPSNNIVYSWRYCKLCQIFYNIAVTEGLHGLYRGLIPSLIKVLPASAINYAVYEYVHRNLIRSYGGGLL